MYWNLLWQLSAVQHTRSNDSRPRVSRWCAGYEWIYNEPYDNSCPLCSITSLMTHGHICHVGAQDVRTCCGSYPLCSITNRMTNGHIDRMTNDHVHHVGVQDVREYIVDLLWQLSEVQHYNITQSKGAKPLTHQYILDAFTFDRDRREILAVYPWLRCGLDD